MNGKELKVLVTAHQAHQAYDTNLADLENLDPQRIALMSEVATDVVKEFDVQPVIESLANGPFTTFHNDLLSKITPLPAQLQDDIATMLADYQTGVEKLLDKCLYLGVPTLERNPEEVTETPE